MWQRGHLIEWSIGQGGERVDGGGGSSTTATCVGLSDACCSTWAQSASGQQPLSVVERLDKGSDGTIERRAVLGGERREDPLLVGDVSLDRLVDHLSPFGGQTDEHAPSIARVGAATDQAGALKTVQTARHGTRRQQQVPDERSRRQLEGFTRSPQAGEHVELTDLEPVGLEPGIDRRPCERNQPAEPAEGRHRVEAVEVGPLVSPLGDGYINGVVSHAENPIRRCLDIEILHVVQSFLIQRFLISRECPMSTLTSTDNAAPDAAERFYDAVRTGDVEGALGTLHPDVVLHVPGIHPLAGQHRGPQGVLDFVLRSRELTTNGEDIEVVDLLAGGSHVAALCRVTANRSDGRALDNRTVHLMRTSSDGRIAEIWFHNANQDEVNAFWSAS